VVAGTFTMSGSAPTGYVFVPCGVDTPPTITAEGLSASQPVVVPPGGAGVGNFYVVAAAPSITLLKSANLASFLAGQTVDYSYLVTNTGNVLLNPVVVTDPMTGLSAITCPKTSLAPSATETCTATYLTTTADQRAGSIENTGTATGTPPSGPNVTATSSVTVPSAAPSFTIVKTALPTSVTAVGQTITDTFVVTNTGNVILTDVGVNDVQSAPAGPLTSAPTCESMSSPTATCMGSTTTLLPGQIAIFTGTYQTTQADLTAGSVSDSATAAATPQGVTSAITSNPSPVTVPVTSAVAAAAAPALAVTGFASGLLVALASALIILGFGMAGFVERRRRRHLGS
jgi:uncharacterized repeat protein (TIGR01451 family)